MDTIFPTAGQTQRYVILREIMGGEGLLDGYNISYSWADTEVRYTIRL